MKVTKYYSLDPNEQFSDFQFIFHNPSHTKIRGPRNCHHPNHPKPEIMKLALPDPIIRRFLVAAVYQMNHLRIFRTESFKNPRPAKSPLSEYPKPKDFRPDPMYTSYFQVHVQRVRAALLQAPCRSLSRHFEREAYLADAVFFLRKWAYSQILVSYWYWPWHWTSAEWHRFWCGFSLNSLQYLLTARSQYFINHQ